MCVEPKNGELQLWGTVRGQLGRGSIYLSRNTATHTTAISSKSTELRVFRRHYNDLQDGIQSPSVLAGLLYSSNIIDADVRDTVQLPGNTVRRKNQVLLNAVEQAISSDPQCFHQLMDSLVDEAANKPLHIRIMDTYCEWSHSTISVCHLSCTYPIPQLKCVQTAHHT